MQKITRRRARRTARVVASIATLSAVLLTLLVAFVPAGADEGLDDPNGTEDTTPTTVVPVEDPPPDTDPPPSTDPPDTTVPPDDPPPTVPVDEGAVPRPTTAPEPQELSVGAFGDVSILAGEAITIVKDAPSGTFDFRIQRCTTAGTCPVAGWGDTINTSVTAGVPVAVPLTGGPDLYRVQEMSGGSPGAPAGWILSSTSCTVGGGSAVPAGLRVTLGAGQTSTCTFTNVAPSITVTKASGSPGQNFDFEVQRCDALFNLCIFGGWTTVGSFPLANDGSSSTTPAAEDVYRIVEDVPTGWRLVDLTCNVGWLPNGLLPNNGAIFTVNAANPDVQCTFTNDDNRVTITKATTPTGAPPSITFDDIVFEVCNTNIFGFCVGDSWSPVSGSPVSLAGGGSTTFNALDGTLFDRLYRVREGTLPPGWALDSVSCTGTGVFIDNLGAESRILFRVLNANSPANATCTVTNSTTPATLEVEKDVIGADADFRFDLPGANPAVSDPIGDGDTYTWPTLFPGATYTLSEQTTPGYSLTARTCTGGSPGDITLDANGNAVAITPTAGAAYSCTYTNLQDLAANLAMTKTASSATAVVGDTITYTYAITNTGPVAVGSLVLADNKLGPIPLPLTQLLTGQSTTATATYVVQPSDAGTTIVNVASLTGVVPFPVILADGGVGTDALNVTATSQASVVVTAVGAAQVAAPAGAAPAGTGTLPRTGSDSWWVLRVGIGLLIAGTALGLVFWRRYRGRTLSHLR